MIKKLINFFELLVLLSCTIYYFKILQKNLQYLNNISQLQLKFQNNFHVSILTPFKLEGLYIEEWIDYHLKLGFDHFYLLDNNDGEIDDMDMINKLKNSSISSYLTFINKRNKKSFNDKFVRHQNEIWNNLKPKDWLFVNLNIDEFFTFSNSTKYGNNIKQYLQDAVKNKCDIICFNWQIFGNNGNHYQKPGKVLERFPNPTLPLDFKINRKIVNSHTKCMGHGGLGTRIFLHDIQFNKEKGQLSCNGDLLPGKKKSMKESPFLSPVTFSTAYIRHIYSKSTEEFFKFKLKKNKHDKRYNWDLFNQVNRFTPNEPFNSSANYTFLYDYI